MAKSREPTADDLVAVATPEEERLLARFNSLSRKKQKSLLATLKRRWKSVPVKPVAKRTAPHNEPNEFEKRVLARAREIDKQFEGAKGVTRVTTSYEIAREQIEREEKGLSTPSVFAISPEPERPPRAISNVEWIGLASTFVLGAAAFVVGALAAAGIIDMGLARIMLLAALIVMTVGAVVVEGLARRSIKRIAISTALTALITGALLFGVISPWMVRKKNEQDASKQADAQSRTATTQSQDDLRAALRADGNRAIRLVTVRVNLKRKYSIEEMGHFRIMYEVATITDRITPEFYLAGQDYYVVNTFVDPKMKQFGYRWTARYREPNNTYRPIPNFAKGRQYGATTGLTPSTDVLEFSWDLHNQIPSDKILEDLNGKELYIFVTESLVDKISEVSFQVNNWELFSVSADRLIFPDDKPIAPWFLALSKEEKAVSWKSVNVRYDEVLPPAIASRYKDNTGWTWSLDFGGLHPKKVPEPELKVDPFKPG